MEHVTIKQLKGNKVLLIPDKGYKISDYNGNNYGIVVCADSDVKNFKVVEV